MRPNEKTRLREVPIGAHPIDRFLPLLGEERIRDAAKERKGAHSRFHDFPAPRTFIRVRRQHTARFLRQ